MFLTENEYQIGKDNLAKMKATLKSTIVNVTEMRLTSDAGDPVMADANRHVTAQTEMVEALQLELQAYESQQLLNE